MHTRVEFEKTEHSPKCFVEIRTWCPEAVKVIEFDEKANFKTYENAEVRTSVSWHGDDIYIDYKGDRNERQSTQEEAQLATCTAIFDLNRRMSKGV